MYALGGVQKEQQQLYALLICERDQALQDSSRAMSNADKLRTVRDLIRLHFYPKRPRITADMTREEVDAIEEWEIGTERVAKFEELKAGIMNKFGLSKWTSCYAPLKIVLAQNDEWWLLMQVMHGID